MKTQLNRKTLAESLALLERIIPSRSANPLLTYLSLVLTDASLVLTGTSGEVDLRLHLPIRLGRELGSGLHVLVPALPLAQVVRSLPGSASVLEVELGRVELSLAAATRCLAQGAKATFQTRFSVAEPEGFPEPVFPEPMLALKAQDLLQALTHVRYAASNEEYRAVFRGIQLEFSERGLRAVASDGYRLALYDLELPNLEGELPQCRLVVPARSVDEMVRVLKAAGGGSEASRGEPQEVGLGFTDGVLGLSLNPLPLGSTTQAASSEVASRTEHLEDLEGPLAVQMAVRLMEGEFPDYERVIPKEFVLEAEAEAEALKESLKRVSVLADRQNHRVDLFFEENQLTLRAEGDYGKGQEELPVRLSGPPMTVSFNARYLLDALGPTEGTVRLGLSGTQTPAVIQEGGEGAQSGYLAVVVPLRV